MEGRIRGDDDEEWDDDDFASAVLEALPGHVELPDESRADVLAELLLELTVGLARLNVLMREADADDVKALSARYRSFADQINGLPSDVRPRGEIGFKVAKRVQRKAPRR